MIRLGSCDAQFHTLEKHTHFLQNARFCSPDTNMGLGRDIALLSAIFESLQFLYDNYDLSKVSISIFVDYSKDFDTIDRAIMFRKLGLYELDDHSLSWFRNYLSDRTQIVKLSDMTVSKNRAVKMVYAGLNT